jgi:exodeoxyribonuclease VIII
MSHIVDFAIDLETASLAPNAAIVQIGAYCLQSDISFGERIALTSYETIQSAGPFKADRNTMEWWDMQPSEIRNYVFGGQLTIIEALQKLNQYIEAQKNCWQADVIRVWGNGSMFDNLILTHAYDVTGVVRPWSYKGDMCYRTLRALYPEVQAPTAEVRKHDAVYDAMYQGKHLRAILQHIGKYST